VAERKFARTAERRAAVTESLRPEAATETRPQGYSRLGGVEQTPELFDQEIVERMGPSFYQGVFSPAFVAGFYLGRCQT